MKTKVDLDENGKSIPIPYIINASNFNSDDFALLMVDKTMKNNHLK